MACKLVCIVGPTSVGKSHLAIEISRVIGCEIVNADSRQVYRGMNIGTAKPATDERQSVPHHLYDILDPDDAFSLAEYKKLATTAITAIAGRKRVPLLVGGTGLYVWAVLDNWEIPEVPPDKPFRHEMELRAHTDGTKQLWDKLQVIDPETARYIPPNNVRRVIRALEIFKGTGLPPSTYRRKSPPVFDPLIIGLTMERQSLYESINARVDKMVECGFIDEVRGLLTSGYTGNLSSMSAIGYRHVISYLRGDFSEIELVELIKRETRHFARRQYSWFRLTDKRIHWFHTEDCPGGPIGLVKKFLENELTNVS